MKYVNKELLYIFLMMIITIIIIIIITIIKIKTTIAMSITIIILTLTQLKSQKIKLVKQIQLKETEDTFWFTLEMLGCSQCDSCISQDGQKKSMELITKLCLILLSQ